ncbi:MAG TPA: hypothetical protein VEB39_00770 [Sphingomicrobium sp.]|nr:hypothetical protein [Sphingomicrobium sp.]
MADTRESALSRIVEGDIVYANIADSGTAVCLVLELTETSIRTRDIGRGGEFIFDRKTGVAPCPWQHNRPSCRIVSTARLPANLHDTWIAYDKKLNLSGPVPIEQLRLSKQEIEAFGGSTDLWEENTLP